MRKKHLIGWYVVTTDKTGGKSMLGKILLPRDRLLDFSSPLDQLLKRCSHYRTTFAISMHLSLSYRLIQLYPDIPYMCQQISYIGQSVHKFACQDITNAIDLSV